MVGAAREGHELSSSSSSRIGSASEPPSEAPNPRSAATSPQCAECALANRHTKHMRSRVPAPYARVRPVGLTLCSNDSRSACAAVQSSPPTFLQQAGETLSAEGRLATLLLEFERLALELPQATLVAASRRVAIIANEQGGSGGRQEGMPVLRLVLTDEAAPEAAPATEDDGVPPVGVFDAAWPGGPLLRDFDFIHGAAAPSYSAPIIVVETQARG